MTTEEAKTYVLERLPCTISGVITVFDAYFRQWLTLEKVIGMNCGLLGYRVLVCHIKVPLAVFTDRATDDPRAQPSVAKQVEMHLKWWFHKYDFKIERTGHDWTTTCLTYWVKAPCEIKEDRRG